MKNVRSSLLLGLLPLFCAPALAGSWTVTYEGAGTVITPSTPAGRPWQNSTVSPEGIGEECYLQVPNKATGVGISLEGDVHAILHYHSQGANDHPPAKAIFMATCMIDLAWDTAIAPSPSAQWELQGAASENQSATRGTTQFHWNRKVMLIQVDTSDMEQDAQGDYTKSLSDNSQHVKAALTLRQYPGNYAEESMHFFYEVKPDPKNRSVKLTRDSAVGEWADDANGVSVTHGDTIYSFTEHQSLQTPEYVPVPQKFTSALGGNWSTGFAPDSGGYNVTWNWSAGDGLEEYHNYIAPTSRQSAANSYTYWNGMSRVSEKGDLEAWYTFLGNTDPEYTDEGSDTPAQKGKSPKTATVKYFVRDNQDQSEAEARYELTLHEPVEIGDETTVSKEKGPFPLFDANGNLAFHSSIVPPGQTDPPGTHQYSKTGTVGQTTGWSFGGGGGVSWGSIKKLLGGAAPDVGVNGDIHWDNTVDYSGTRATTYQHELTAGQSVYIAYTVAYNEHTVEYRSFGAAGENRSAASPAIVAGTKPLPSVPYQWKWQSKVGTSLEWMMMDTNNGDSWPDYSDNSETILPSGGSS